MKVKRTLDKKWAKDNEKRIMEDFERDSKIEGTEVALAAAFNTFPHWRRPRRLWLAQVSRNGLFLAFVPSEMRDWEMCLAAVMDEDYAIYYVPRKMRLKVAREKTK